MNDINLVNKDKKNRHDLLNDWLFDIITDVNIPINFEVVKNNLSNYLVEDIPNVISEENFYCGNFAKGGGMFSKREDRFIILNRIKQIFPNAKIMLGIRNKKHLLLSWYKQFVAVGGILSFDDFIKNNMNLEYLNYEKYIEKLEDAYGKKNIYIYKFENLIEERERTIKEICGFIGCSTPRYKVKKRNVGYGKKEIKAGLLLNRLFKSEVHNRGINYPYKHLLLPHRYLFQSKVYNFIPREKVKLEELIKNAETKKLIEPYLI